MRNLFFPLASICLQSCWWCPTEKVKTILLHSVTQMKRISLHLGNINKHHGKQSYSFPGRSTINHYYHNLGTAWLCKQAYNTVLITDITQLLHTAENQNTIFNCLSRVLQSDQANLTPHYPIISTSCFNRDKCLLNSLVKTTERH